MSEQQKTGSVTALGIISIVFGLMTMLLSFVPCFGSYALFLSFIPLILGCAGYYIAKKSNQPTGLPLTGIIMSLIGFSVAGSQYYSISRWSSQNAGTEIGIFVFFVWAIVLVFFFIANKNNGQNNISESNNNDFLNKFNLSGILNIDKTVTNILNCPTCQNQLATNDVFCAGCGTNVQTYIQMAMLASCPSCNNSITANDVFCSGCGFNLNQYKKSQGQIQIQPTLLNKNISNSCISCGKEYLIGDAFCENCGNKLI